MMLAERATDGEDVILRGLGDGVIQDSAQLVVEGRDYRNEDEARTAGNRWRGLLEKAFAAVNLGVDFGDRAPISVLTDAGAKFYEAQLGQQVLNDVHGLMTFECQPRPRFVSTSLDLGVGRSAEHLAQKIAKAREIGASTSAVERLAYDLYSASFTLLAADARFVMLMMAVETLIEPAPRSDAVRAHVKQLIVLTGQADLPSTQKDSVVGSLRWLMGESISQAGRRLAATLGDRIYMDQTPAKFFSLSRHPVLAWQIAQTSLLRPMSEVHREVTSQILHRRTGSVSNLTAGTPRDSIFGRASIGPAQRRSDCHSPIREDFLTYSRAARSAAT